MPRLGGARHLKVVERSDRLGHGSKDDAQHVSNSGWTRIQQRLYLRRASR